MTNHRSEPDSAPGGDEPYEYRGLFHSTRTRVDATERRTISPDYTSTGQPLISPPRMPSASQ